MSFPNECHVCYKTGETRMCVINVPFFKELVIMAFNCKECGAKTSEIKCGGEIGDKAKEITLKANC